MFLSLTAIVIAVVPEEGFDIFIPRDTGYIDIYFTAHDNLSEIISSYILSSYDVSCAFFDLEDEAIISSLERSNARVVIDDEYSHKIEGSQIDFVSDFSGKLMHNKFCILDDQIVITGSMNPTERGINHNDNNVVIINSKHIAKNYLDEFNEMHKGIFHEGSNVRFPEVYMGDKLYENYFCPEDDCKKKVYAELSASENSIYFMTFSFTDDDIGNLLLEKYNSGFEVKGIFETTQAGSSYSQHEKLKGFSIRDNNKYTMHHKVFIIDNETVITGSYNPTKNADENNDENILIIHDKRIADIYLKEFERVMSIS